MEITFEVARLRGKPLTEQRHGEKFSAGTPTSSSAPAILSDDSTATQRNPVCQNARPILALAGFKRVIRVINYQKFMPDPFDFEQFMPDPSDFSFLGRGARAGSGRNSTTFSSFHITIGTPISRCFSAAFSTALFMTFEIF